MNHSYESSNTVFWNLYFIVTEPVCVCVCVCEQACVHIHVYLSLEMYDLAVAEMIEMVW